MNTEFISFNGKDDYVLARLNDQNTAVHLRLIGEDHVAYKDLTKDELIMMAEFFNDMVKKLYSEEDEH